MSNVKEGGVAAILQVQSNIRMPMEYFQYSSTKYSYLHDDIKLTLRDIPEINPPPHIPLCVAEPHKKQLPVATHSTLLRPHFSARIFEYYIFRPFRFCFFFLSFFLFLAVFVCLFVCEIDVDVRTVKKKKNKNKKTNK